jgi:hypothetical protein
MAAPMPLEPPVTKATLPVNDFVCITVNSPGLCILDCSIHNKTRSIQNKIRNLSVDLSVTGGKQITASKIAQIWVR